MTSLLHTLHAYSLHGQLTNEIVSLLCVYADVPRRSGEAAEAGGKGTSYTYTPDGKLATRAWTRGVTTTYTYTNGSSLAAIDYSDDTPDVTFTYDRLGRQKVAQTFLSAHHYAYDPATLALASETIIDLQTGATNVLTRATDALGRELSLALNGTYQSVWNYDALGRTDGVAWVMPGYTNAVLYGYIEDSDLSAGWSIRSVPAMDDFSQVWTRRSEIAAAGPLFSHECGDYGFRWYDTDRGRWLARDPIGERAFSLQLPAFARMEMSLSAGGNLPVVLNPYVFLHNDSVAKADLLGLLFVASASSVSGNSAGANTGSAATSTCTIELWCWPAFGGVVGNRVHCEYNVTGSSGGNGRCRGQLGSCEGNSFWKKCWCDFTCLETEWQPSPPGMGKGAFKAASLSVPESTCDCLRNECKNFPNTTCYEPIPWPTKKGHGNSNTAAFCLNEKCSLGIPNPPVSPPWSAPGWGNKVGQGMHKGQRFRWMLGGRSTNDGSIFTTDTDRGLRVVAVAWGSIPVL